MKGTFRSCNIWRFSWQAGISLIIDFNPKLSVTWCQSVISKYSQKKNLQKILYNFIQFWKIIWRLHFTGGSHWDEQNWHSLWWLHTLVERSVETQPCHLATNLDNETNYEMKPLKSLTRLVHNLWHLLIASPSLCQCLTSIVKCGCVLYIFEISHVPRNAISPYWKPWNSLWEYNYNTC